MTITINNREHTTPDSWNDCTKRQSLYIYGVLMAELGKEFDLVEQLPTKRIAIMRYLLGLREIDLENWTTEQLLEVSQAVTAPFLEETLSNQSEAPQYSIALKLTKNPFPEFVFPHNQKKRKYLAPADGLDNLSIYELGTTFTIFEAYLNTQDEQYVNQLLAILYREHKPKNKRNKRKNYEGDRRLPYLRYEATVAGRQKKIEKLPPMVKAVVLFWFASCRQEIINQYPNIFSQEKNGGEKLGNNYGWGGVLMGLADGLVHLDAVSRQNYQNAFTRLSWLEDQRKEMEMKKISK